MYIYLFAQISPMNRLLAFSAELSIPPSSPSCYRDVSLWANTFAHYDVVATVDDPDTTDYYNIWFKRYGLWDFIDDIIPISSVPEDAAASIENGPGARLTIENLWLVLAALPILPPDY